jgi:sugar phosphate isomerase/epimerase
VSALGVASFAMTPEVNVSLYEAALQRGAQLGASCTSVRILDLDESRAARNFGDFCRMAVRHGIQPGIEFMGYGAVDALPQALRILKAAGCGKISLDTLHAVRTGTPMAALRQLDPSLIGYFQMSDGPLAAEASHYAREGAFDRLPPGEGEFPLREILPLVPGHLPISLEVPTQRWRAEGMDAEQRARRVVEATRRLLAEPPLGG